MTGFETIGIGILSGIVYGASAFLKTNNEPFDYKRFAVTSLLGGFIGVSLSISGTLSSDSVAAVLQSSGCVVLIQNILQVLDRKVKAPVVNTVTGAANAVKSVFKKK